VIYLRHYTRGVPRPLALCICAAVLLSACGQPSSYDPAGVLRDSGRAMAAATTFTADASFGKGATSFGFGLDSAHAVYRRPADSDATIKARHGDAVVDFELVVVGGHTYLRVPLIGWQEVTNPTELMALPDFGRLLDNRQGLPAVVPLGTSPVAMGHVTVDGHDCYQIRATYTADQVAQVITVLKPSGPVTATLWIDSSSSLLRRIRITGALYDSGQSSLDVHLRDFGAAVTIAKPV